MVDEPADKPEGQEAPKEGEEELKKKAEDLEKAQ